MKLFFLTLLIFLINPVLPVNAQKCNLYFPESVGSTRETKHYDNKDRLTAIDRYEVLENIKEGNKTTLIVKAMNLDGDGKLVFSENIRYTCEDGKFHVDLRNNMDPNTLAAYEDMDVTIEADNLTYPSVLKVGEKLDDGQLIMTVKTDGITIATITLTVHNRKIEAKENITTEAGTFSCYKISYDLTNKVGFITTNLSAIEWMSDGVGLVKSETYNRRGKLTGYSKLTSLNL